MSSSGQGDQIPDKSKDEEGEITSTTSDNGITKPIQMTETDREAVSIAPDSTAESSEGSKASGDMASSDKPQEGVDTTMHEADISNVLDTNLSEEVTSIVTKPSEKSNTDLTTDPQTDTEMHKASSKDVADLIQDDDEKDSSSASEELELRWEEDDDDMNVEAAPTHDVLKMLDRELGMDDVSNKFEDTGSKDKSEEIVKKSEDETNADQNVSTGAMKMLETRDVTDIQDVQSILTLKVTDVGCKSLLIDQTTEKNEKNKQDEVDDGKASNSFEESQKIIDEIDSLTQDTEQDIKIKKNVESSDTENIENAETIDDLSKEISEDIVMEDKVSNDVTEKYECLVPVIDKIDEVPSESSTKYDLEEKDVDSSESIHKEPFVEDKQIVATDIATIKEQPDKIIEAESIEDTLAKGEQTEKVSKDVQDIIQTVDKLVIPEDSEINKTKAEIEGSETNITNKTEDNASKNLAVEMDVCNIPSMIAEDNNVKVIKKAGYSQTDVTHSEALTKEELITKDADVMQIDVPQEIDEHEIAQTKIDEHVIAETKDDDLKIDKTKTDEQEIVKTKIDEQKIDRTKVDEDIVNTSLEDSVLDITITPNIHHRINKPNVMLDIPTQELSDIEAELDEDSDSELNDISENNKKTDIVPKDSSKVETLKTLSDIKESVEKENIISKTMPIKSPSIEDDVTSTKTNISTVSPLKSDQTTSKSAQNVVSELKSLKFDDKPSTSQTKDNVDTSSTSKIQDVEKPSTSEKQENIKTSTKLPDNVEKSSTSKTGEANDVEMASTSQTQDNVEATSTSQTQDNVETPLTSINKVVSTSLTSIKQDVDIPTSTQDDEKPSTSKVDDEPTTSIKQEADIKQEANIKQETGDAVPSTSEKLTPDDDDDIQEITDSLGLLAESSRVMDDNDDDDDDAEDPEADENDDDEDFDPYEESSNQMLEDLEDSNTPPPDMDAKNLDMPPKVQESDEGTMDLADGTMDIVDDIECVENELPDMDIGDASETPNEETEKEGETGSIATVQHEVKKAETKPPQKIISILEKVLGQTDKKKSTSDAAGKVLNYVEVDGSSDSDDVLEVSKSDSDDVMSVNIPAGVEVMSTSGPRSSSEILSKKGEVVISGVPKPPPLKVSKLNTSEVSIKTAGKSSPSIHIPEAGINKKAAKDEIFNLDSDEDETEMKDPYKTEETAKEESPKTTDRKCINPQCVSESGTYYQADRATVAYFSLTRRSGVVCEECKLRASERAEALISGVKDLRPLLELEMDAPANQLVEISDSDEDEDATDDTGFIGVDAAKFLEEHLADMLNETWVKYNLESRLKETEICLMKEMAAIEADAKEIDAMLDECQKKTDAIRTDFYKDYEVKRKSVGGIIIYDTPFSSYSHTERDIEDVAPQTTSNRYPKRRATSIAQETPAKKQAIPLGYSSLDGKQEPHQGASDQNRAEDDKEDISVVKLSAESAPADLPPCGEITRPPLKAGMVIYAMRNAFGTWLKGKIMDVQPKIPGNPFTQCKVKFEHKVKNPCKVLAARCLAYTEPPEVRMTIGTRVIALFKDPQNTARRESFYSGVVAEIPNPVNNYRYLVFFDDGYAQYVHHQDTRIVCESSSLVWEEVHPFIRDFICNYLLSYPERPMVRLHKGERLKTEWNGKWWESKVLQVDASIALIHFDEDNRTEWIYRGSTRLAPLYLELQAAEKAGEGKTRSRLPRSKAQMRSNMPCVEYTRSDEQPASKPTDSQAQQQHNEELRRQRSVAKKSTTPSLPAPVAHTGTPVEGVISRVVYYTPKNAVKPYKMSTHTCSIKCKRTDLLSLKDLRTYNPLAKPLLSGWERQTVRYKGHREVMYRAPCGRRLRNMAELHKYLRILQSDMSVDLFDFTPGTHCLAEFVLNKCIVGKKDLSHGKENVPVPCVNYYDDSLPEFCSYNTERTPTAGVPLNLDPEFLCGCDCTDDCVDKTKCACWKMTLEGAKTIGMDDPNIGYVYRRLPEPLPSGIYECNSRCKCKQTCLNRVAQHPLQLKLQVFKTINRGWGIRALNDVPKGSFLCVYAGNLLTDATANLDGLNEGDEYLAELDYIEVVEGMKEGYEDDIPEADKKLDKKAGRSDTESPSSSESEDEREQSEKDDDFQPGYIAHSNMMFKKSLRKREKAKKKETEQATQKEVTKKTDDCITISDDEEVREPSRFTAQAGMDGRDLISKHSSRVSVRTLFGKDEACYIMDAKVQGNIGRYLNHSCHPNVFVQNVFVDTHDPRFPWVAFFALSHVRAGTELTWNYNYDIGSVPGKCLYCYCGAPNCRGRLL